MPRNNKEIVRSSNKVGKAITKQDKLESNLDTRRIGNLPPVNNIVEDAAESVGAARRARNKQIKDASGVDETMRTPSNSPHK